MWISLRRPLYYAKLVHNTPHKIELIKVCSFILQHFQVLELTIILARTPVAFTFEIILKDTIKGI